jgi:Protein kinase C terminal domain
LNEIKNHSFFQSIDWRELENKSIPPPFIPKIDGESDLSNIDKMFTKEAPKETPENNMYLHK